MGQGKCGRLSRGLHTTWKGPSLQSEVFVDQAVLEHFEMEYYTGSIYAKNNLMVLIQAAATRDLKEVRPNSNVDRYKGVFYREWHQLNHKNIIRLKIMEKHLQRALLTRNEVISRVSECDGLETLENLAKLISVNHWLRFPKNAIDDVGFSYSFLEELFLYLGSTKLARIMERGVINRLPKIVLLQEGHLQFVDPKSENESQNKPERNFLKSILPELSIDSMLVRVFDTGE